MSGSSWRRPCRWFWGSSWASSLWSRWSFTTSITRWLPTRSRSLGTGPNISTWARGRWAESPQQPHPRPWLDQAEKQQHFTPAHGIYQHSSSQTDLGTQGLLGLHPCLNRDGGIRLDSWGEWHSLSRLRGRRGGVSQLSCSWWLGLDAPRSNAYNSEEYLTLKCKDWNHSSFGKTPLKVREEHWMLCSLEHRWLILYYRQCTQNTASCSLQQDPWTWSMLLAGILHVLWLSRECFTAPCTQRIHSTRTCLT